MHQKMFYILFKDIILCKFFNEFYVCNCTYKCFSISFHHKNMTRCMRKYQISLEFDLTIPLRMFCFKICDHRYFCQKWKNGPMIKTTNFFLKQLDNNSAKKHFNHSLYFIQYLNDIYLMARRKTFKDHFCFFKVYTNVSKF